MPRGPVKDKQEKRQEKFAKKRANELSDIFKQAIGDTMIAPVVKQIAVVRIIKGISLEDMATACNMKRIQYIKIERGKLMPSLHTLLRMAFVVGGKIEFTGWMDYRE